MATILGGLKRLVLRIIQRFGILGILWLFRDYFALSMAS